MDQRASDVEEDLKNIRNTREALADKIQLLEKRVEYTMRGTKAATLDMINFAKNKAVDFIESTTHYLDPSVQARRRPWILVGSAVAIGVLAALMEQQRRKSGVYSYYPPRAHGADVMPSQRQGRAPSGVYPFYPARRQEHASPELTFSRAESTEKGPRSFRGDTSEASEGFKQLASLWNDLTGELAKERERLQEAALQTGRWFIQDLSRIVARSLIDQLTRSGSEYPARERRAPHQ